MSVEATAAVWAMRGLSGTEKLVLVRLADHADPEGGNAFPSASRLAADTGLCERTVRQVLRDLQDRGVLSREGTTKAGTVRYRVDMKWQGVQEMHPAPDAGVQEMQGRGAGDAGLGVQEVHPNRKKNRKKPSGRRATPAPPTFPISDALREWAATKARGVNLERETDKFLSHHKSKGSTFKDWEHAWRNWMMKAHDWMPQKPAEPIPIRPVEVPNCELCDSTGWRDSDGAVERCVCRQERRTG